MTAITRHPCGLCGKQSKAEEMIFSRFTRSRYCGDDAACRARAKKKRRAAP